MSNIVKRNTGVVDVQSTQQVVGSALMKTGLATGGIAMLAALPLISLPLLIVLLVVSGGALYLKG